MTPTEINRRVAEACGLRCQEYSASSAVYEKAHALTDYHGEDWDDQPLWKWDPYHDANDALWAAERVGLFDDKVRLIGRDAHGWAVEEFDGCYDFDGTTAEGPTLPACLCAAILALKENQA